MTDLRSEALASKAWPFEEARKLLARWPDGKPGGGPVVFETGYGPSGLPHIGTFNEVLRTTLVRRAFATLSDQPTQLVAFSDDLDGLRKVPDNVPNGAMLAEHLGRPLSRIPDPFETHPSFAAHNNALLRDFLDRYGFDYTFLSATDCYTSGRFDDQLRNVLRRFDGIMAIMLPTLRAERRATYSPVLPVSPVTGVVLQVPVEVVDADAGLIAFEDASVPGAERIVQSALGGQAKLQWKVDWAMRWVALGVDYEMAGKDLIDSVVQSGRIARALGGRAPEGFNYEMFLDERGEKISKSKGNGLGVEDWLRYGPEESLAYYIYREPKRAKSLHPAVIPRAIDDYWTARGLWHEQGIKERLGNPVHHLHDGRVPQEGLPVSFGLLLNLVGVLGEGATGAQVWRYLARYLPDATPADHPALDRLIGHALAFHRDHLAATVARRAPTAPEAQGLRLLDNGLAALPAGADAEAVQTLVYETGKAVFGKEALKDWFRALYETLLGQSQGPRMGSFVALYGISETRALLADALARGVRQGVAMSGTAASASAATPRSSSSE